MDAWLKRARQEIETATAGMTAADWENAPDGKWNAAAILEHLSLTFSGTARMLGRRLESVAPEPVPSPTFKQRIINLLIFGRGEIPEGRQAPDGVRPKGIEGTQALANILRYLSEMEEKIDEAERRWGSSVCIAVHPILGPLTADKWRRFHFIHTRHHMRQVRERRQSALPGLGEQRSAKAS